MPLLNIGFFQKLAGKFQYDLVRQDSSFSANELEVLHRVEPYTMTGRSRLAGLTDSVRHVVANQIHGDVVECGVWRGGSMMAAALTLLELGDTTRDLYLFDTYEGMPQPTEADVGYDGRKAQDVLDQTPRREGPGIWSIASLEDVQRNLASTGYPQSKIHFIKGKVEDTVPQQAPGKIAILRLDTDWYESTKHEMEHLYPRLAAQGILIIDDYGHWQGSRRAIDEYFSKQARRPFLSRLDYTGRLLVKPGA